MYTKSSPLTDGHTWNNTENFIYDERGISFGYTEEELKVLRELTMKEYNAPGTTDKRKEQMIETAFKIYRGKNIFPIQYFNEKGIKLQLANMIQYQPELKVKEGEIVVSTGAGVGTKMNDFLFPNMYFAWNKNSGIKLNMVEKFMDDKCLRRACRFGIQFSIDATPKNVYAGLRLQGAMPSNFRPMNARIIYQRYCKPNGTIYDYAMGFGGRMLGCMTSPMNYNYIGTDPNTQTFKNLTRMKDILTKGYNLPKEKITIHNECSENLILPPNSIDFAFSSPPYFDLEVYSDEGTQSYIQFNTLDLWFEHYVKPTFKNIFIALKDDTYMGCNIADFKRGKEITYVVDRIIATAEEVGFKYHENIKLQIPVRAGENREERQQAEKKEGIFIFRKGNPNGTFYDAHEQQSLF